MLHQLTARLGGYGFEPITDCNYELYFEVYAANQAFFLLTAGKEASPESISDAISQTPPGFELKNKYFLGVRKNGAAVGVLDFLIGYPEKNCLWIGLLIIHGEMQGKQAGSEIVHALLNAAKAEGLETAQLGVIENNTRGMTFWQKFGFQEIRQTPAGENGLKTIVMEKRL